MIAKAMLHVKRLNVLGSGLRIFEREVKTFEDHLHTTVDLAAAESYEKVAANE